MEPSRLIAFNQLLSKYLNITQVDRNIQLYTLCLIFLSDTYTLDLVLARLPWSYFGQVISQKNVFEGA